MVSRGLGTENSKARRLCEGFVSCRIGLEFHDYHENLEQILQDNLVNKNGDFLLTPIASPRSMLYDDDSYHLIPDLILPATTWETRVAISISHPPMQSYDAKAAKRFDKLFRHALYLPTPVVVIDCPHTTIAQIAIASIVNDRLKQTSGRPFVLFRISLRKIFNYSPEHKTISHRLSNSPSEPLSFVHSQTSVANNNELEEISGESGLDNTNSSASQGSQGYATGPWRCWNAMRSHLEPDLRIGVCLELGEDLDSEIEELAKWAGEPIRMVILSSDHFVSTRGCKGSTRLQGRCREFLRAILLPNSFKTSFVLQARPGQQVSEHLDYLTNLRDSFEMQHPDQLRGWNDVVLNPLQPLSMNLDSNTYRIFELDEVKYTKYRQAMVEALDFLILRRGSEDRQFIIMILGAGRGPLVDAMIEAIKTIQNKHRFKIYALDKNYSSVRSLKYKQRCKWSSAPKTIQVEVVEGDMRTWEPKEKADIVATELLGSFSDNELSPECIDGTYRFAAEDTISIPQEYRSHLAPICSYRMHQEMHNIHRYDPNAFDQIYVVRLSNYYTISEPQELFAFEHMNLSAEPVEGANQRFKKLTFWASVNTVCHGFAGFFSAKLFGSTSISTVPEDKTPSMESWFPAFIPLEKPIQMAAGTSLEVFFSRKDSISKVWYEWVVMHPEKTRIHSPNGINTAMSKLVE